jgi:hypothetical protein
MTSILANIKLKTDADWALNSTNPPQGNEALQWLEQLVKDVKTGSKSGASFQIARSTTDARHACQFLLCSSTSGTIELTVNGVASGSTTASGTDTADATALAAAINADADAGGLVIASNYVATITFASATSGDVIHLLDKSFLAGTDFSVAGNDTADAAAFITAVRAIPYLADCVYLDQAAGVVYIGLRPGYTPKNQILRSSNGTRLAVSNATFAAAPNILLWCPVPGKIGNAISLSVTGTGLSIADSATAMENGAGYIGQTASSMIFGVR